MILVRGVWVQVAAEAVEAVVEEVAEVEEAGEEEPEAPPVKVRISVGSIGYHGFG